LDTELVTRRKANINVESRGFARAQRKGIGSEIIQEHIRFAKEKRYASFFVKTSNKWKEMLRLLLKKGLT
jgi:GNAT superfamily N-acetyltransferase